MKLQFIRDGERILGLAMMFGKATMLGAQEVNEFRPADPPAVPMLTAECSKCGVGQAIVFCKDHNVYLCEFCLTLHNNRPALCTYLSLAAAIHQATQAKTWEAHT